MRLGIIGMAAAVALAAGVSRAEPPQPGVIIRNPHFDRAVYEERVAPPITKPTLSWVGTSSTPAPIAMSAPPATPTAAPPGSATSAAEPRVVEPRDVRIALSAATSGGSQRIGAQEPGRFLPPADAQPLTAADDVRAHRDAAVIAASNDAPPTATTSPASRLLSAAIDAQLGVTRLTANPYRGRETGAVFGATNGEGPNPLR